MLLPFQVILLAENLEDAVVVFKKESILLGWFLLVDLMLANPGWITLLYVIE